ncbi:hypothetical protein BDR04DRAFT_1073200 [Suillus decipiens]|nr:hypothetical protein BDR04DRAFT_1073200 [Suillus decipiens]
MMVRLYIFFLSCLVDLLPNKSDFLQEKTARATLFTAITIPIIDRMKHIKGFRFQLYCKAREADVRVATAYVLAIPDKCRKKNGERAEGRDINTKCISLSQIFNSHPTTSTPSSSASSIQQMRCFGRSWLLRLLARLDGLLCLPSMHSG